MESIREPSYIHQCGAWYRGVRQFEPSALSRAELGTENRIICRQGAHKYHQLKYTVELTTTQ